MNVGKRYVSRAKSGNANRAFGCLAFPFVPLPLLPNLWLLLFCCTCCQMEEFEFSEADLDVELDDDDDEDGPGPDVEVLDLGF